MKLSKFLVFSRRPTSSPPPPLFLVTRGAASLGVSLGLGDEAPVVFVDEDSPETAVTVPHVEVVLVPTTGFPLADDGHPEHNVLSLHKINILYF